MSTWESLMMAIAAASSTASPGDQKPITLIWQKQGELVELKVVGLADRTTRLTYVLDVKGSSSTRTSGIANLTAGAPKTLSTVRLRPTANWQATLYVTGDSTYTLHQPS